MALRDTSWITDTHFLETKHVTSIDRLTVVWGSIVKYERLHTVSDGEWICLTEAAAIAYADTHAGDTNMSFTAVEDNRYVGSWKLQKHTDSRADWSIDT